MVICLLANPVSCDQDPIIPVLSVLDLNECVTGIFILFKFDDIIHDSVNLDKYYQLVLRINEYVATVSLIFLHRDSIEDSEEQDIVSNIYFETIIPPIKKNLFIQQMVDSVNELDLSGHKYKTNGAIIDEHYKGKLLFNMKDFMYFVTYRQSMHLIKTYKSGYKVGEVTALV